MINTFKTHWKQHIKLPRPFFLSDVYSPLGVSDESTIRVEASLGYHSQALDISLQSPILLFTETDNACLTAFQIMTFLGNIAHQKALHKDIKPSPQLIAFNRAPRTKHSGAAAKGNPMMAFVLEDSIQNTYHTVIGYGGYELIPYFGQSLKAVYELMSTDTIPSLQSGSQFRSNDYLPRIYTMIAKNGDFTDIHHTEYTLETYDYNAFLANNELLYCGKDIFGNMRFMSKYDTLEEFLEANKMQYNDTIVIDNTDFIVSETLGDNDSLKGKGVLWKSSNHILPYINSSTTLQNIYNIGIFWEYPHQQHAFLEHLEVGDRVFVQHKNN